MLLLWVLLPLSAGRATDSLGRLASIAASVQPKRDASHSSANARPKLDRPHPPTAQGAPPAHPTETPPDRLKENFSRCNQNGESLASGSELGPISCSAAQPETRQSDPLQSSSPTKGLKDEAAIKSQYEKQIFSFAFGELTDRPPCLFLNPCHSCTQLWDLLVIVRMLAHYAVGDFAACRRDIFLACRQAENKPQKDAHTERKTVPATQAEMDRTIDEDFKANESCDEHQITDQSHSKDASKNNKPIGNGSETVVPQNNRSCMKNPINQVSFLLLKLVDSCLALQCGFVALNLLGATGQDTPTPQKCVKSIRRQNQKESRKEKCSTGKGDEQNRTWDTDDRHKKLGTRPDRQHQFDSQDMLSGEANKERDNDENEIHQHDDADGDDEGTNINHQVASLALWTFQSSEKPIPLWWRIRVARAYILTKDYGAAAEQLEAIIKTFLPIGEAISESPKIPTTSGHSPSKLVKELPKQQKRTEAVEAKAVEKIPQAKSAVTKAAQEGVAGGKHREASGAEQQAGAVSFVASSDGGKGKEEASKVNDVTFLDTYSGGRGSFGHSDFSNQFMPTGPCPLCYPDFSSIYIKESATCFPLSSPALNSIDQTSFTSSSSSISPAADSAPPNSASTGQNTSSPRVDASPPVACAPPIPYCSRCGSLRSVFLLLASCRRQQGFYSAALSACLEAGRLGVSRVASYASSAERAKAYAEIGSAHLHHRSASHRTVSKSPVGHTDLCKHNS
eukprot:GHVT01070611.1.p1 GENE.GHVT01070611.1~~GHVT01070611.1.p1  ORF type:complete len:736 (-),score=111.44 GHVT01070611.1:1153-3360(-)